MLTPHLADVPAHPQDVRPLFKAILGLAGDMVGSAAA